MFRIQGRYQVNITKLNPSLDVWHVPCPKQKLTLTLHAPHAASVVFTLFQTFFMDLRQPLTKASLCEMLLITNRKSLHFKVATI